MKTKILCAIAVLSFFAASAGAAVVAAGAGSYTDTLPAGKTGPQSTINKTGSVTGAVPTNDWWTSLLASPTPYRMFAFPLCYNWENDTNGRGLLIGYPSFTKSANLVTADTTFVQQLLVEGTYNSGANVVTASSALVDGYSDWTVTTLWKDQSDPSKYFKTTFGHGLLFTYFEFADGVSPRISFPDDWGNGYYHLYNEAGVVQGWNTNLSDAYYTLEFNRTASPARTIYYGLFLPTGSIVYNDNGHRIRITLPAGKNFMSVGLMKDKSDLATWKNYAYAFVTGTSVSWSVDAAKSTVQTTFNVTTASKQGGQTTTLLALFPHQWKHATVSKLGQEFATLRGTMSVVAANSFTVTNRFQGIVPFLPNRGDDDVSHLKTLLAADKTVTMTSQGTYWHGKELCRLSNLIPIAGQVNEDATLKTLTARLKSDLANWLTYTPGENYAYFYYDKNWGSLIGYTPEYGHENFTDQHFHFGYFIYASAILAMYDKDFAANYGPMVEMLIRSCASPKRDDAMFPFLRTFDPYEGHSWADGRGLANDGNNQESSAEAMNAWAGIYLWGVATGNATYRDLGIWGYTTEYSAIREYYFDIDGTQYGGGYNHDVVGILWGGKADYGTWFSGNVAENVHGIQLLPLNASMLYPGYDTAYAQANYNQMKAENGGTITSWKDTFWRFRALFDAPGALAELDENITFDSANSKTFTYHWLHEFNAMGTVDTSVYADTPSYAVFTKSGQKTYAAFNPSDAAITARFYRFSDNALVGTLQVPARAMASTKDFSSVLNEALPLVVSTDPSRDVSLSLTTDHWNAALTIPGGAFPGTVSLSIAQITPPPADRAALRVVPVGFQVETDAATQPSKEITITFSYDDSAVSGFNEQRLAIGRYDETQQMWLPLSSVASPANNRVTARTNHLSRFGLLELASSSSLGSVRVYPNPYRPGSGTAFDRAGGMVFSNLTAQAQIRIYSAAGELVFEGEADSGTGMYEWNAVNTSGQTVASGVYIYRVTSPVTGETKTGKIAVIK